MRNSVLAALSLGFLGLAAGSPAIAASGDDPAPVASPALKMVGDKLKGGGYGNVHSLLVFRAGKPLAEFYRAGADEKLGYPSGQVSFDASTLHDIRSVSKSVTSLLFGIAMAEGKVPSLDTPAVSLFPEYGDLQSRERQKITLRDLMTMSAGLQWDEDFIPYSDPRNSERMMDVAKDPIRYALEQPIAAAPGATFRYSGGNVAVIGAIIERGTGMKLDAYANKVLFKKLGIAKFDWIKDPHGSPWAASGLRLRPRDLAKIGLLVLQNGKWHGAQIVPSDWIADATSTHIQVGGTNECGVSYGYFWWLGTACSGATKTHWIAGIGYGAQRLWIVPADNVVIASTAGLYADPKQSDVANTLFRDALIATAYSPQPK